MTQQPYYPPAPAQQYVPAPPQQYQPQVPQQPVAPQYPGYPPQQGYAPAPAQYAPQPQAPAQPLAAGTIDDYYSQPSTGGGAGLKFSENNQPIIGQSYVFQVARPIGNGDVQQQTNNQGVPQTFRDGRPKFVMIVPVQLLEPSPNHPDGLAKWYVKGGTRDELARAMAEAGAPEGPPENGAVIRVTLTGTRSAGAGNNPAHVFAIQYVRPQGAAPVQPAVAPAQPAPEVAAAPALAAQAPVQAMPPAPPQYAAPAPAPVQQYAQPVAPPQYQQAPAAPAPQVQQAAPQPPAGLSPEQQELLARMQAQG